MSGSFKKLFARVKETRIYKKEKAKIDFTIELDAMMKKTGHEKSGLGKSAW